jgi:hypothetical protein
MMRMMSVILLGTHKSNRPATIQLSTSTNQPTKVKTAAVVNQLLADGRMAAISVLLLWFSIPILRES